MAVAVVHVLAQVALAAVAHDDDAAGKVAPLTQTKTMLRDFFGVPEENFLDWKEDSSAQPMIASRRRRY